jgi:hypothetical protein
MTGHKDQHFIPQCYLKAWCDPDTPAKQTPYVWLFPKDGSEPKKKAPVNLFYEKDMYTIERADGTRNLGLERGLGELESRFTRIRDTRLAQNEALTPEELANLCEFVAAMDGRTKARREHEAKYLNKTLGLMEGLIEEAKKSPEKVQRRRELPPSGPTLTYDQVKQMAANPIQHSLGPTVKSLTPSLVRMDLAILTTDDALGFITCDHPCIWFDPVQELPGLMYQSTEIRVPVSPQLMIIFNNRGYDGYRRVGARSIDELNRITRFHAHEHFIVNTNKTKEIWFEERTK